MTATASQITSSTRVDARRACPGYELARYTVTEGERILTGLRVNGEAVLVDLPAGEAGRVYLVERDLDQDGNHALRALITDYCRVACELDRVPMARTAGSRSG